MNELLSSLSWTSSSSSSSSSSSEFVRLGLRPGPTFWLSLMMLAVYHFYLKRLSCWNRFCFGFPEHQLSCPPLVQNILEQKTWFSQSADGKALSQWFGRFFGFIQWLFFASSCVLQAFSQQHGTQPSNPVGSAESVDAAPGSRNRRGRPKAAKSLGLP